MEADPEKNADPEKTQSKNEKITLLKNVTLSPFSNCFTGPNKPALANNKKVK